MRRKHRARSRCCCRGRIFSGERDGRSRQEKDLRLDLRGLELTVLDLRRVLPEAGGLRLKEIANHHPVEFGQGFTLEGGVLPTHGRVLPDGEEPLDGALVHRHEHGQVGMIAGVLGQVVIPVVVVGRGVVAKPRLQLADDELGEVRPVRGGGCLRLDVIGERVVPAQSTGRVQITGKEVIERGNIG